MASIRTKFTVGLFVIIGFSLVIVAVVWLGMSNYLEKGKFYVAFFDESVQGLDKDSPVKYRGVAIGRVQQISVASDANLIQVVLKIDAPMELESDIVAQLKSVGITGIMYIELERRAKDEPNLSPTVTFATKYPVIATRPSGIKKLFEAIQDAVNQFNQLDIDGLARKLQTIFENLNTAVENARVDTLAADMRLTLAQARNILDPGKWNGLMAALETAGRTLPQLTDKAGQTVDQLDTILSENRAVLNEALQNFNAATLQADAFLADGRHFLAEERQDLEILQHRLAITLENLELASGNLNRLTEMVAAHPAQLLLGTPPPEKNTGAMRP
jgi:phospholipid/cholesterol/gamma-HCH transport system substrate-binding protein